MLSLIALLSSAHADPISVPNLPHTTTFQYSWTSPVTVSGNTPFTFANGIQDTSTVICTDLPGCMSGTFSTGNSGTGVFNTDLRTSNCRIHGAITTTGSWFFLQYHVPIRCDVDQDLNLVYDTTTAAYTGSAFCGFQDYTLNLNVFLQPIGITNKSYTYSPGLFSGTLSGPGTGTFAEI